MKFRRIKLPTLIFSFLRIYCLLVLVVYFFQDKLVFFPKDHPFADCKQATTDGFVSIDKTFDDSHIRLLMKRGDAEAWLLLFHGNGGTACASLSFAEKLASLPIGIALAEYPGYEGDSEKPSQESLLANALAIYDFLKFDKPEVPIMLYGESLGTGVATYVASRRKTLGLMLQSPYTSAVDVGQYRYPFLPVRPLTHNPFPAYEWAPQVEAPVLILHGTADWSVPIRFGEEESKHFKHLARFVKIEGAGHNDVTEKEPGRFWGEVSAFILQLLKPQY